MLLGINELSTSLSTEYCLEPASALPETNIPLQKKGSQYFHHLDTVFLLKFDLYQFFLTWLNERNKNCEQIRCFITQIQGKLECELFGFHTYKVGTTFLMHMYVVRAFGSEVFTVVIVKTKFSADLQ